MSKSRGQAEGWHAKGDDETIPNRGLLTWSQSGLRYHVFFCCFLFLLQSILTFFSIQVVQLASSLLLFQVEVREGWEGCERGEEGHSLQFEAAGCRVTCSHNEVHCDELTIKRITLQTADNMFKFNSKCGRRRRDASLLVFPLCPPNCCFLIVSCPFDHKWKL